MGLAKVAISQSCISQSGISQNGVSQSVISRNGIRRSGHYPKWTLADVGLDKVVLAEVDISQSGN